MRNPGEFNRRIALLAVVRTPDGGGGYIETVETVGELWAKVEPLQGDEQTSAMQTGMQRPHRFIVPYRASLSATSTIEYDSRTFDVKSVIDPDAAHFELIMLADEVLP